MNYYTRNKIKKSIFEQEEYFPVVVKFSDEEIDNCFVEYSYRDSDMMELIFDSKSHELKQLTLTLCNHYLLTDTKMPMPNSNDGTICTKDGGSIECSYFETVVYKDGVEVKISNISVTRYEKCGQIIFALSDSGDLLQIFITDLNEDEINHVRRELMQF